MTDELEAIRERHQEAEHDNNSNWATDHGAQAHFDRETLLRLLDALPELLDRVERLEADMQVIAFGSRIVANADNTLSHVDWTREQLVEFARAALAKDATT